MSKIDRSKALEAMAKDGYAPAIWAVEEIARLRKVVYLASQDLSLIVAKHAIGKDRTAVRMTKYLNAEKVK